LLENLYLLLDYVILPLLDISSNSLLEKFRV